MQAIFSLIHSGNSGGEVFKHLLEHDWKTLRQYSKPEIGDSDDSEFLRELYYGTLQHLEDYNARIKPHLQNWDISRVAAVDKIIMAMTIHEWLTFSDIPVRASLNEYIDIARDFSTENSARFVNGVLDAILTELKNEGLIKKVGRGLL